MRILRGARNIMVVIAVVLLLILTGLHLWESPESGKDKAVQDKRPQASTEGEWYLTLVNRNNPIPDGYQVELTELSNGQSVDGRIYPSLQEMFDGARAEGIYPVVGAGYRTREKQQSLMDEKIQACEAEGNSRRKAEQLAANWVAIPGTSEHEIGIAVDINADTARSSDEQVYQWLAENAHKYGFILRYPPDKTEITGTIYEPWHYRYVGEEAAGEIYSQGICLEEYLK